MGRAEIREALGAVKLTDILVTSALENALVRSNKIEAWYREAGVAQPDGLDKGLLWLLTDTTLVRVETSANAIDVCSRPRSEITRVERSYEVTFGNAGAESEHLRQVSVQFRNGEPFELAEPVLEGSEHIKEFVKLTSLLG